jgi:hypothetical protein
VIQDEAIPALSNVWVPRAEVFGINIVIASADLQAASAHRTEVTPVVGQVVKPRFLWRSGPQNNQERLVYSGVDTQSVLRCASRMARESVQYWGSTRRTIHATFGGFNWVSKNARHSQPAITVLCHQPSALRLFLHLYRHRDRFQRNVALVSCGGDDLVDDVEPAEHFAEDRVTAIQPAVVSHADKKL